MEKKIAVCQNSSLLVYLNTAPVYNYELYKDGKLFKKYDSEFYTNSVLLTESGKYYFIIMPQNQSCLLKSDTVEIISASNSGINLTSKFVSCNKIELSLENNLSEKFRWYYNESIIAGEEKNNITINNPKIGKYYAEIIDGNCPSYTNPFHWGTEIISSKSSICEGEKIELKASSSTSAYSWKNPKGENINSVAIIKETSTKADEGLYILNTQVGTCIVSDSIDLKIEQKPNINLDLANPYCANQNLIIKLKRISGFYEFKYNFDNSGKANSTSSFFAFGNNLTSIIDLGKILNPQKDILTLSLQQDYNNPSSCTFKYSISKPEQNIVDCNDIFEFTNLKDKYCLKEAVSLSIKSPKDVKPSTKFNLSIITSYGYSTYLGKFQFDKIEFQIPESGNDLRYKIESEDKKYVAYSKGFNVDYLPEYIDYDFDSHCKGHFSTLYTRDSPDYKIEWKKDGVIIQGETSSKLKVYDPGIYTVLSASKSGCKLESKSVKIYDNKIPKPYIYSKISSNSSCEKSIIPLGVSSNDYPYTEYEWLKDNVVILKTNSNVPIDAKETGIYKLKVSYSNCSIISDSLSLTFGKSVENYILGNSPNGLFNPLNSTIEMCNSAKATLYTDFPSRDNYSDTSQYNRFGVSFQWFKNGNPIQNENKPSISATEEGEYKLLRKQKDCVSISNPISISNISNIKFNLNYENFYHKNNEFKQIELCKNESLDIYAAGNRNEFSNWDKDLIKNGKIIETRSLSNQLNYDYTYNLKEEGQYHLKLSNPTFQNCFVYSDTINIKMKENERIVPADTVFLCEESKKIRIDYDGDSFLWKHEGVAFSKEKEVSISKTGTYTLDISNNTSCATKRTFFFTNKAKLYLFDDNSPSMYLRIKSLPSNIEICKDQMLQLDVLYNSLDEIYIDTYDIYKNDVLYKKSVESILINEPGNYYVKSNQKYCEGISNKINIVQNSVETKISPTLDSLFFCKNGFQTLELSTNSSNKFYWYSNNTLLDNSNTSLKASKEGEYFALVGNNKCFEKTKTKFLKEKNVLPTAVISGDTIVEYNTPAFLKVNFTSSPPFQFTINDTLSEVSEKTLFQKEIKPSKTETYQITSLKNTCGTGTFTGKANIQIIILGTEPKIGDKIILFPNPSFDYCHLSLDLEEVSSISAAIVDSRGIKIKTFNWGFLKSVNEIISLQNLNPGVYFIKLDIGKETVTRKIVKN